MFLWDCSDQREKLLRDEERGRRADGAILIGNTTESR